MLCGGGEGSQMGVSIGGGYVPAVSGISVPSDP
jgi:hypothetical protein